EADQANALVRLQQIQHLRLTPHVNRWSAKVWDLVSQGAARGGALDPRLQAQAASALMGLDAKLIVDSRDIGASYLAFDRQGERLLMGGVTDAKTPLRVLGARIRDDPLLSPRDLPGGGSGPVGFHPDGTPIQLVPRKGQVGKPDELVLVDLAKGAITTR